MSLGCLEAGRYLPNNRSPVLLGAGCMLILRHPDVPYLVRSVKLIGLLHLTAWPLTCPFISVPAYIYSFGLEEKLSGRQVLLFFFLQIGELDCF